MKKFHVLDKNDIKNIRKILRSADWRDGKDSATGNAKNKKENFQLTMQDPLFKEVLPFIQRVHEIPLVKAYTNIKGLLDPRVALYQKGGKYGWHVDATFISNNRTDLSFTICLNEPEEYEGGELNLEIPGANVSFKGRAGEMIVYPSGLNHQVTPVTAGERLVAIGWLSSHVKQEESRQRLWDLRKLLHDFVVKHGNTEEAETLTRLYHQLTRDFS